MLYFTIVHGHVQHKRTALQTCLLNDHHIQQSNHLLDMNCLLPCALLKLPALLETALHHMDRNWEGGW